MKLTTRRILFCFCFVLFLVSSPLVILYAFGFRYDFTQKKLIQTGIIYITPNIQDNIKILIDDKEELNKVSTKGIFKKSFILYNLIPKTYNIKIDKENYHRWEKNLIVSQGLTTYVLPLLLPSNPKTTLIFNDSNILLWSISDKFKKIFYLKNDNKKMSASIYDFSKKISIALPLAISDNQSPLTNIVSEASEIFLAPDGKKIGFILSTDTARIILLNSTEKNILPIDNFVSSDKIIDGQWDETSRYFLYLNEKNEITSYDTASKTSSKVLKNILGFSIKNSDIYYLDSDNLFFYKSRVNTPLKKQQLSYIPLILTQENNELGQNKQSNIKEKMEILISEKNTLAVVTPEKNLFIISQNGTPVNIGNNIDTAVFSKNGENLVFNSSYEIFTYTPADNQENLITRSSQKISNVNWYSDDLHIWFLTNQTIKNIELDSRPTPNIIDFINIPKQPVNILYTDTNNIYYDQIDNGNLSIYQAEIQK